MTERPKGRLGKFYSEYLPIGDRIGEMFYATWMAVVSLGILNSVEVQEEYIPAVIAIAFAVNITWGIIDGISVMLSGVIVRARNEKLIYDLRAQKDPLALREAHASLDSSIALSLGSEEKDRIIAQIAEGPPGSDPYYKRYYPEKADWYYVLGILAIDTAFVIPIVAPLLILPSIPSAILVSRIIATMMFAILGAAYARNLNRRRWLAALFLGTLGFSVSSLAYLLGW